VRKRRERAARRPPDTAERPPDAALGDVSPPPDTIEAHRARLIDAHQVHGDFVLSIRGIIASPSITSRVRWTLHRNFVTNFVTQGLNFVTNFVTHRVRRGNFVTNFVTPSISAPPRRVINIRVRIATHNGHAVYQTRQVCG
jgi:hypothetical protein